MSVALVQACAARIGEIRAAWDWLGEQAVPGPGEPPAERHVSVAQQLIEDREVRRDRAARHPAGLLPARRLHERLGPAGITGPHADAARVSPIHGRIIVAAQLRRAAESLHTALNGTTLRWRLHDPTQRVHERCHVCSAAGRCSCDIDDAQVAAALYVIGTQLDKGMHDDTAAVLLAALDRANRDARRAAGAAEMHLVLKAACPACDARDLVADCTSPNRDEWSIRCRNGLCRCAGTGCGCGCRTRYEGKGHLWPARDGQWHDLAIKLGVALPELIADAMRRPGAHQSSATGSGGRS